jgi:hypothetical protein
MLSAFVGKYLGSILQKYNNLKFIHRIQIEKLEQAEAQLYCERPIL